MTMTLVNNSVSWEILRAAINAWGTVNDPKLLEEVLSNGRFLTLNAEGRSLLREAMKAMNDGLPYFDFFSRLRSEGKTVLSDLLSKLFDEGCVITTGRWAELWQGINRPLLKARLTDICTKVENEKIDKENTLKLVDEAFVEFTQADEPEKSQKRQLSILTDSDAEIDPEISWVLEGILPTASITILYGATGAGKSFISLDWCMHIAMGADWLGRKVCQGPTLYLVGEGPHGFKRRITAAKLNRWPEVDQFYWCRDPINLMDSTESELFTDKVRELTPKLIVIDTLTQYRGGAEENSATEMGPLFRIFEKARQICNSSIIFIHHPTKYDEEIIRGTGSLLNSVDCAICVKGDGKSAIVGCKKMRDAEPFMPITLALNKVSWASPKNGIPIDSLQVSQGSDNPAFDLARSANKALDYLKSHSGQKLSADELSIPTGISRSRAFEALRLLSQDGSIKSENIGRIKRYYYEDVSS